METGDRMPFWATGLRNGELPLPRFLSKYETACPSFSIPFSSLYSPQLSPPLPPLPCCLACSPFGGGGGEWELFPSWLPARAIPFLSLSRVRRIQPPPCIRFRGGFDESKTSRALVGEMNRALPSRLTENLFNQVKKEMNKIQIKMLSRPI